jgi:hypothetical protein
MRHCASGLNGLPCMPLLAYFTSIPPGHAQFNILYIRPTRIIQIDYCTLYSREVTVSVSPKNPPKNTIFDLSTDTITQIVSFLVICKLVH